jgi:hypothetical protein
MGGFLGVSQKQAVPVHDGGCARLIHKIDVKALAGRERDARVSVRPDEAEHSSRFAVDGESPGAGSQAKLSGAGFRRGSSPDGAAEMAGRYGLVLYSQLKLFL